MGQLTLYGKTPLEDALDRTIAILREFEPPEGYHIAVSGGKDSTAVLHSARLAGVKFDAHYNMTTVDPPELTRFLKTEFPEVQWEVPAKPFWQHVEKRGLPLRRQRWCCREFKEVGGAGRRVVLGLRAEESAARAKRGVFQPCYRQRKWFLSPILHWTEEDVWEFHAREGLPHCSLYDEGWARIGCVVCPFEPDMDRAMERWPVYFRLVRQALGVYFAGSEACQRRWPSTEAMWRWWLARRLPYPKPQGERPPSLSFEEEFVGTAAGGDHDAGHR